MNYYIFSLKGEEQKNIIKIATHGEHNHNYLGMLACEKLGLEPFREVNPTRLTPSYSLIHCESVMRNITPHIHHIVEIQEEEGGLIGVLAYLDREGNLETAQNDAEIEALYEKIEKVKHEVIEEHALERENKVREQFEALSDYGKKVVLNSLVDTDEFSYPPVNEYNTYLYSQLSSFFLKLGTTGEKIYFVCSQLSDPRLHNFEEIAINFLIAELGVDGYLEVAKAGYEITEIEEEDADEGVPSIEEQIGTLEDVRVVAFRDDMLYYEEADEQMKLKFSDPGKLIFAYHPEHEPAIAEVFNELRYREDLRLELIEKYRGKL